MKVWAEQVDVEFEGEFVRPVFEIASGIQALVPALHKKLSSSVRLKLDDMSVQSGPNVGGLAIQLALFNGTAQATISIGKIELQFRRIHDRDKLQQVLQCSEDIVTTCQELAGQNFSEVSATLRAHVWFRTEKGDAEKAVEQMRRLAWPAHLQLGDNRVEFTPHGRLKFPSGGDMMFMFEQSAIPRAAIYGLFISGYPVKDIARDFRETSEHFSSSIDRVLKMYGFEPQ